MHLPFKTRILVRLYRTLWEIFQFCRFQCYKPCILLGLNLASMGGCFIVRPTCTGGTHTFGSF